MRMINLLSGSTTADTTDELRPVLSRCSTLLLVVPATVLIPVATRGAVSTLTTTRSTAGRSGWAGSLFVSCRDNLSGEVKPIADRLKKHD